MSVKSTYPLTRAFVLILLFGSWQARCQMADVAYYMKAYPLQSMVYLERSAHTEMRILKSGLSVVQHHHEKFMILKSGLSNVRKRKIGTTGFITVKNIKANLYVYNGKSHKKQAITDIELRSENNSNDIFYNDEQYYYINFLNAKEGDIVVIDYDDEYTEPRLFGSYYISDYVPAHKLSFSVTYPAGLSLKIKEMNNQRLPLLYRSDSIKNRVTKSWSLDSLPPLTEEYLDPGYRYKATYVLMSIENYRLKDSLVNVCGSLKNLYAWNMQLMQNVDLKTDDNLKKFTDSLVKNDPSDHEKMRSIFHWVQKKIAYLAYEDGLGGYIPREAPVVCNRRFGDCKDMANLIVQMGKIAGLPVYPAWIGTREIPHNFSDFPATSCANHLIAVYIQNGDTLFLDATGKHQPFGLPTSMIQGKEALTGVSRNKFTLARVPWLDASASSEHDSVLLRITAGNNLSGTGYYSLTGYEKIRLLGHLEKKSYDEKKKTLKGLLEKGNNKFQLDTFEVLANENKGPLVIRYQFTIRDYVSVDNRHTFINLNFLAAYFDRFNLVNRKYPIHFRYRFQTRLTVHFDLMNKYAVDFMPENIAFSNSLGAFNFNCVSSPQSLFYSNTITMNESIISGQKMPDFENFITKYKFNKSGVVSLLSKNPGQ